MNKLIVDISKIEAEIERLEQASEQWARDTQIASRREQLNRKDQDLIHLRNNPELDDSLLQMTICTHNGQKLGWDDQLADDVILEASRIATPLYVCEPCKFICEQYPA